MVDATLPQTEDQKKAAHVIGTMLDKALGFNVNVEIKKGARVKVFKEGASEDIIQLSVKSDEFVKPEADAEHYARLMMKELHKLYSLRDNAVFLPPKEYLEFGASEVLAVEKEAEKLGIKHEGVELSKAVALRTDVSQNQKTRFASQYIGSPANSTIRIQIATNPDKLEEAETLAQKVAKDIERRLPEIKAGMIARIKRKNYKTLTAEQEKHLQEHELKVSTQQQSNWTSVFVEIISPEQKKKKEHPEVKILKPDGTEMTPEEIQKTNMLEQIENADSRAKLAARSVLYQGEELRKPASYFIDVAGTDDMKMALAKMVEDIKKKSSDTKLIRRAEALLKENFLISNELWNLPTDQQPTFKQQASATLEPGTNELRIKISVPKGKANDIFKELAAPNNALINDTQQQSTEESSLKIGEPACMVIKNPDGTQRTEAITPQSAGDIEALNAIVGLEKAGPEVGPAIAAALARSVSAGDKNAVVAAAAQQCAPDEIALASGAAAAMKGAAGVTVKTECIPVPESPLTAVEVHDQGNDVVVNAGGGTVTASKNAIQSFLATRRDQKSHAARVVEATPATSRSIL